MIRRLLRLLSSTRRAQQRELDEEIETHLELRISDLVARGHAPDEARERAVARFGDLEKARRQLYVASARRDRRLTVLGEIDDLRRDLMIVLRRMRARKARTAMLLAIYALGIGVTTSMFTVVDNVLLRALPFSEPRQLVELQSVTEQGYAFPQVSMGNWYDWQQSEALAETGIYRSFRAAVATGDRVERVAAAEIGGSFFEALRPRMELGRPLAREDASATETAVVLSERFWQQRFNGDRDVLGQTAIVDGSRVEVIGVVARGYELPKATDLWTIRGVVPRTGSARNNINYQSVARLADGVSIEQAKGELDTIAARIRESDPEGIYSHGVGVIPLREAIVGSSSTTLKTLMASVLLVLLIACVNLMGLTFAEGRERRDEVAVRLALGAGRYRLTKQLVTEQVALGLVGGALGLLVAALVTRAAVQSLWSVIPRADEITFDSRIAWIAVLVSIGSGLLSGWLPAWRISSDGPAGFVARARVVAGGHGFPGARLVIVEIALTVVLLICGGLLVRSLSALVERDLGFDAADIVTLDIGLSTPDYRADSVAVSRYWERLIEALEENPTATAVGMGTGIPTGLGAASFIALPDDPRTEIGARYRVISDDYFATLGVRLVSGRWFGQQDTAGSERVVIINRAMADRFWPDESPLGQSVAAPSMEAYFHDGAAPWLTIVGVVEDIRQYGFEDTLEPAMFTLYRQIPQLALAPAAVVRVRPGNLAAAVLALEDVAREVDPTLAVEMGVLETRLGDMLSERKLTATIILALALMALLLASLGLYGLLAFAVAVRTPELAVRSALGARQGQQVSLLLRGAGLVVVLGAALGLLGAFFASNLLRALLVDVHLTDPTTYLTVGAVLIVVALIAVAVPTARAARLNPAAVLRKAGG